MLDRLLAHHTDGAAAALAAHVTLRRARREKQDRLDAALPHLRCRGGRAVSVRGRRG